MLKSARDHDNRWGLCHGYGTVYGIEETAEIFEVLLNWAPTNDAKTREFEQAFARYSGARHAIAVSSCFAALHLAAVTLGIGPGDEVLVPPLTFVATANAFAIQGARVRFVDVDPVFLNMDPQRIDSLLTERTRAIIPVDLYGCPCDMDSIMEIGRKHGIPVIEDAAHTVGAKYKGRAVGSLADITAFSFQRAKNMSTLGEGGMITTDNPEWADRMTALRQHGGGQHIGLNYRMTDVQAAVGLVQLSHRLDKFNEHRRRLAQRYNERLAEIDGVVLPAAPPYVNHAFHLYSIRIDERKVGVSRDEIIRRMKEEFDIVCIVQYPCVHLLDTYRKLGHAERECPIAEAEAAKIITLPIGPRLDYADIDFVVDALKKVVAREHRSRSAARVKGPNR
ncbi:MAG TPA: DegT/DnrJ/EryC1/StrS family aminotransferase [Candidatus Binatia bacterium]|nr:DegT/DnrJ/EryC1/StrS family aminotransferase [Candidatus Binatia bacterium]